MKLSDLSTGQAVDVLLEVTPLVAEIAGDENAIQAIGQIATAPMEVNRTGVNTFRLGRYSAFLNIMLKEHRNAVFGIMAALNQTTPGKIEKQPMTETLRQLVEIVTDQELRTFFNSFMPQEKITPSVPSVPAPDTSAQEA